MSLRGFPWDTSLGYAIFHPKPIGRFSLDSLHFVTSDLLPEPLAATEKNILGNDMNRLWDHVKTLREKTGGRVDFILDNAGF